MQSLKLEKKRWSHCLTLKKNFLTNDVITEMIVDFINDNQFNRLIRLIRNISKENLNIPNYPSLLDESGQEVLSNFKVGGLEIEAVTPKTPRTPRSRSRIAFSIPDEETEM